jgi:hypothetical protein
MNAKIVPISFHDTGTHAVASWIFFNQSSVRDTDRSPLDGLYKIRE